MTEIVAFVGLLAVTALLMWIGAGPHWAEACAILATIGGLFTMAAEGNPVGAGIGTALSLFAGLVGCSGLFVHALPAWIERREAGRG